MLELITEEVRVGSRVLRIERPPDAYALIDEEAFARDEFLPYWAELWPSGVALARVVDGAVRPGDRVLELGCGLALPSIVAALAGARVVATDWSAEALRLAGRNAAGNGAALETLHASWSDGGQLVRRGPWDLVLAADVLYERRDVPVLASLLGRLVAGGSILLADPGRPHARMLVGDVERWVVERLPSDPEWAQVDLYRLHPR